MKTKPRNMIWINNGWQTLMTLKDDNTIIWNAGTPHATPPHGQWSLSGLPGEIKLTFHCKGEKEKAKTHTLVKVPGENEAYTTKSGKQCTLVRTLDGPADEV